MAGSSIFLVNLTYSHSVFLQKNIFWVHTFVPWSSFPWQHQMSVRELRHDRPSGRFSKSQDLSASVSLLSYPPPPSSFIGAIFRLSFLVLGPKLHGNAWYAGYVFSAGERPGSLPSCFWLKKRLVELAGLRCRSILFQQESPQIPPLPPLWADHIKTSTFLPLHTLDIWLGR